MYSRKFIREQLIDAIHGVEEAKKYFEERFDDPDLLNLLIKIAMDDYSTDASAGASYWISHFEEELLEKVEEKLLILQKYKLGSISAFAIIALSKINSEKGRKYLLRHRVGPNMKWWESEALEKLSEER
ncbi:hypothetical protein [Paenibacillus hubeiensis]|uniref:hypothetical protein n=1 Tax=Paenibacillus hubeiensis TaxID=3077330 RepID=UPI0031B9B409